MSAPAWLTARPIAHRGLHDRVKGIVENTLSAADAAIAGNFAIECDVQDSADGEAVVFHDHTLERLTDQHGPVRARTAAELTGLSIAATADRIVTLQTFLDRVNGRVPVIVEIKSRFDGDLGLTRRVAEIASGYGGPVALKSFDPAVVAALRDIAPDLPRGIVAQGSYEGEEWRSLSDAMRHSMANLLHLPQTRPDFISWWVGDLPLGAPLLRQVGGLPIMTWTVRTDEDRRRAAAHADQMVFEGFRPDL
jgi:glycerophosphoryl diester phosphodiesterase